MFNQEQPPYAPPSPYDSPYATPYLFGPRLSPGLKACAVAMSVLKAIPLVIMAMALVFAAGLLTDLEGEIGEGLGVVVAIIGAVALVAGALLVGQMVAALKNNKLWLAVFSGLLSVIDAFFVVSAMLGLAAVGGRASVTDDNLGGLAFIVLIAVCQIGIFVWALASRTDN